jgi:hypothetical protein
MLDRPTQTFQVTDGLTLTNVRSIAWVSIWFA